MTRLVHLRLALFAIGIIVWGYGYTTDDATVRWIAIGCLFAALLLRFFQRSRRDGDPPTG